MTEFFETPQDSVNLDESLTPVQIGDVEPCFVPKELCIDEIDDDHILNFQWSVADRAITNVVIIEYDYDHTENKFLMRSIFKHQTSIRFFGERDPLIIQSQGMHTELHGLEMATIRAKGALERLAFPPIVLDLTTVYMKHLYEVGDIICVTGKYIPNRRLGIRGIDRVPFDIIEMTIEIAQKGKVQLKLLESDPFNGEALEDLLIETTPISESTS